MTPVPPCRTARALLRVRVPIVAAPSVAPPTALNWPLMVEEPVTANAEEVAEVKVAALNADAVVPVAVM